MSTPQTALIVAGGRGTRLLPITEQVPKPMLPFCGGPFLAGLARRLAAAGVRRVGLIVGADPGPFASLVDLLAPHDLEVFLVPEPEPLDTAGGVRAATLGLDGPVLVLNGDVLSDLDIEELGERHAATGAAATISLTRVPDTSTFGVCVLDGDRITAFVEKPPPGSLPEHDTVNAGAYVLAERVLERFQDGPLSFEREVFPSLLDAGDRLTGVVHEGVWTDLGTPERFLAGQRIVLDGAMRWPPLEDMEDLGEREGRPSRLGVRVGQGVRVASDVRFDAPVVLGGGVSVGSGAAVGPFVVVADDAIIGDGADISDALLCEGAIVGHGAIVADAIVARGARVAPGEQASGPVAGPPTEGHAASVGQD